MNNQMNLSVTLARPLASLTPTQSKALDQIEKLFVACRVVALSGPIGSGKTTILETFERDWNARFISNQEIREILSESPAESSDSALFEHVLSAIKSQDVVILDDLTSILELGQLGDFGARRGNFRHVLLPLLYREVRKLDRRLLVSGRDLALNGSVPEKVENVFMDAEVPVVRIGTLAAEDYSCIFKNTLGAAGKLIDAPQVYKFASALNMHQLAEVAAHSSVRCTPTAQVVIDVLSKRFVRSNVKHEEVEELSFDSLYGAEEIVRKLETHVVFPLENQEIATQMDLRPKRGVLLYGPPGTGKTSIGRALAHRMKGRFFLIDGSVVPDWPGFFFMKIKRIIDEAKENAPSVVFIDDADVLFTIPHIAGLPRYLLSLLDGIESESANNVCVMMTAMDVRRIPEALMRSGRVELWLETKAPSSEARAGILKRWMTDDLPHTELINYQRIAALTENATPADLRRLVSDAAALHAADKYREIKVYDAQHYLEKAAARTSESQARMKALTEQSETSKMPEEPLIFNTSEATFDSDVLQAQKPVIAYFWAPWCVHCVSISKQLDELAAEHSASFRVAKINCDQETELAAKFEARSVPRLCVFSDGEIIKDHTGLASSSELRELVELSMKSKLNINDEPLKAKYGVGVGGMAELGVGCKMSGW